MTVGACCLALFLLALGGCGDDDGGGGGSDTALSKEEFIERGDEICMGFDEDQQRLEADIEAAGNDTDELVRVFEEFAADAESVADEFEDLDAPEAVRGEFDEYISGSREQIAQLREASDALAGGDTEEFTSIVEAGQREGDELDEQAKAIGFQECGDSG